ncbi:unnamed protein product [Protopolystoma xenopodis]|uniref:Uncharacterized protein n=1 Tax=Protopolystoma xenopodis TaxID=117903 RepID=A0A3S4ZUU0_9PLAT|nr:unnamed protein product [Protopolystoma xenopodis]
MFRSFRDQIKLIRLTSATHIALWPTGQLEPACLPWDGKEDIPAKARLCNSPDLLAPGHLASQCWPLKPQT